MLPVIIIGAILALLGVILALVGCIQGGKRIKRDKSYIAADGELIGFKERVAKVKYKLVITVYQTKEYSPIFRYRTEEGETIESASLPFTLKLSPSYKEYDRLYQSGERVEIKYDPEDPEKHFYKSRTAQFIREAFYKVFSGLLLIGMGVAILSMVICEW